MNLSIRPRLVVPNVHAAIAFYEKYLGAKAGQTYAEPSGHVVHNELRFGTDSISLTQARSEWGLHAPDSLGGSPVLLTLTVADSSAVASAMTDGGATVLVPIEDRPYGKREGRVRDPFGHLWVVSQDIPAIEQDKEASPRS